MIKATGIYKDYGRGSLQRNILKDLNFELKTGEFLCIMGPSGSGKTTLLHLLCGLDHCDEGDLTLDGDNLAGLSRSAMTTRRRKSVAQVFQFFNLMPNLTCIENVGLPLAIAGGDPDRDRESLMKLLERFGIANRAHALPHQMSGGEMQRCSIARAVAGGQPILLCDEPTGNLSQQAGQEVMTLLRKLCDDDGRSILLVTHNPRDASYADRLLFLINGGIDDTADLRGPNIPVESIHKALAERQI